MSEQSQNYIKQMHDLGRSDEEIRQELKKAGWTDERITAEFKVYQGITEQINPGVKTKKSINKFILVVSLVVVFAFVGGIFGILYSNIWNPGWNFFGDKDVEVVLDTLGTEQVIEDFQQGIEESEQEVVQKEFVQCDSINCLIEQAHSCKRAELFYGYSLPVPFFEELITISTTYLKIEGKNVDNLCVFIQQAQIGAVVIISEEERQILIEQGITEEEIDLQIRTIEESLNSELALTSITCTGLSSNVVVYLDNLKESRGSVKCKADLMKGETVCVYDSNVSCITKFKQDEGNEVIRFEF